MPKSYIHPWFGQDMEAELPDDDDNEDDIRFDGEDMMPCGGDSADMDGEALMPGDPGYHAAEVKADLYHDISKES